MNIARSMATMFAISGLTLSLAAAGQTPTTNLQTDLNNRLSFTREAIDTAELQDKITLTRSLALHTELTNIQLQDVSWLARNGKYKPGQPEALIKRLSKLNTKLGSCLSHPEKPGKRDLDDFRRYRR